MVISRGRRSVAVTDHSKFGRQGLVKVCDFSDINEIITDSDPPDDIINALDIASVRLTLATGAEA
jgi:DeoR family glycerol-3-phosphate regulon repressor